MSGDLTFEIINCFFTSRPWNISLRSSIMYTSTWVQSNITYNCAWPAGPTTGCGWAGIGASPAAGSVGHWESLSIAHSYWVPIAFHALVPHISADAELCINELMTMVAVKQVVTELEDHGDVWVIAIHWHVVQAQLHFRLYATMQQALYPLHSCLICQLLEHTAAVIGKDLPLSQEASGTREHSGSLLTWWACPTLDCWHCTQPRNDREVPWHHSQASEW